LIARSSQAFMLSSVGCCRLVLALDSHVGDGCRRSFAGGSGFSKRTFVTGYYRPHADDLNVILSQSEAPQRKRRAPALVAGMPLCQ